MEAAAPRRPACRIEALKGRAAKPASTVRQGEDLSPVSMASTDMARAGEEMARCRASSVGASGHVRTRRNRRRLGRLVGGMASAALLAACDGLADAATCGVGRTAHDWPGPLWRVVVEAPSGTRLRLLTVEDNRDTPVDVTAPDTVRLVGDRVEAYAEVPARTPGASLRLVLDNETRRWTPTDGCRWHSDPAGWARIDVATASGGDVAAVEGIRTDPPFDLWRYGLR